MSKRFTLKDIDSAYKAGQKTTDGHTSPSPETIKMVGDLDKKLEIYCMEMKNLKDAVDKGFEANSKEFKEIVQMLKDSLETKANKWVESTMVWFLAAVGMGLMGVVGTLIFQAIVKFNQ
jgi:preprotein translocase subunit Sss1